MRMSDTLSQQIMVDARTKETVGSQHISTLPCQKSCCHISVLYKTWELLKDLYSKCFYVQMWIKNFA